MNDRIAVMLWLYHKDLWPEFYDLLAPLSEKIHLYLGLEYGSDPNDIIGLSSFDKLTISYHDNYGADVAPFLKQLQSVTEPLFIKLHSKKSTIGPKQQIHWRSVLVNSLIGSKSIFINNIDLLNNPDHGLLGTKNLCYNNREYKNTEKIIYLCDILQLPYEHLKNEYFIAGNMFMSKTDIFQKIFTPNLIVHIDELLQEERGKISDNISGKYSHALERIFGYIIKYRQLKFVHPDEGTIKIKQNLSPTGFLSLVVTYDGRCYLKEDLCVFGNLLSLDERQCFIEWHHLQNVVQQEYVVHRVNDSMILEKTVS